MHQSCSGAFRRLQLQHEMCARQCLAHEHTSRFYGSTHDASNKLLRPCCCVAATRYAAEHSVAVTTFDCVSELHKIAAGYPSFKCVLRIRCDDASAKINLGLKYGADMCDVPLLLGMARDLGLQVRGERRGGL